mgnify:CR=1 FL=1
MPASYLEQDEGRTLEGFNEFAHMTVSTEGTIVLSMKTENVNQWEKNRKLREAEESELNAVAMLKFKGDYDFHADEDMQALCKKLAHINTRRFLKEYKDMKVCHVCESPPTLSLTRCRACSYCMSILTSPLLRDLCLTLTLTPLLFYRNRPVGVTVYHRVC